VRVRDYEIERVLGQGGMGRVYAARHARLGERVALKELLLADPALAQQFLLEAKLLYGLRHPCFPTVKDYFTAGGKHYLVMDLIAGDSLQDLLDRERALAEPEVRAVIAQLLEGLAHLHGLGVVHRDIKPGNIMVDRAAGRAVLVDFGIAKALAHAAHTVAAVRGAFTPHMAPPEQYRGEPSTFATDVYQVGATAYYAATGVLPPESVRLRSDAELPDPRLCAPALSAAFARAVLRAMALAPDARYPSAAAMLAEWRPAQAAPATGVSARALDTYRAQRAHDIRRRPT
jgi:serine/threonine protein kinase